MRASLLALIVLLGIGATDALAATSSPVVEPRAGAPVRKPEAVAVKAPVAAPRANPLWGVPLTNLSATRERPLFAPSRRPPPPPAPVVAQTVVAAPPPKPPEPEAPPITLVGTVIGESAAFGLFVDKSNPKTVIRLMRGDAHQGWVLRAIERRDAAVEKGHDLVILALPPPAKGTAPPATAMAPPKLFPGSGAFGTSPALPAAPAFRQAPVRPERRPAA